MSKRILIGSLVCLCLCAWSVFALAEGDTLLYTGVTSRNLSLRATEDREGEVLAQISEGERVSIYSYSPEWLDVETKNGQRGYLLRQHVKEIERLDPENTLPYGAVIHRYSATVQRDTQVYLAPDESAEALCDLTAGANLSLIRIIDGWAEVPFQRKRGYVHLSYLRNLAPVSPTIDYAQSDDMLATYTSYYSVKKTELNSGRMINIQVSCDYISIVMEPGERFSFNAVAGPYRPQRGYMPAPVLIDGGSVPGYGGGTCQVSSTLYNVLLQLDDGITIVKRRAHGPSGATYLPHGVDAAVGNESIDLIFENSFSFPIRIQASAQDGALCISIYKA